MSKKEKSIFQKAKESADRTRNPENYQEKIDGEKTAIAWVKRHKFLSYIIMFFPLFIMSRIIFGTIGTRYFIVMYIVMMFFYLIGFNLVIKLVTKISKK